MRSEALGDALGEVDDVAGMLGGVRVLGLEHIDERAERVRDRRLDLRRELVAVERRTDLRADGLGEQQVVGVERVRLDLLEVHDAPDAAVDDDRQRQLRARVGGRIAPEVVGVMPGVRHEREATGACDAAVDAVVDRLFEGEEAELLDERTGGGEHPKALPLQALDHGEVEAKGGVELRDRALGDRDRALERRELTGEVCRHSQTLVLAPSLVGVVLRRRDRLQRRRGTRGRSQGRGRSVDLDREFRRRARSRGGDVVPGTSTSGGMTSGEAAGGLGAGLGRPAGCFGTRRRSAPF